MARVKVSQAQYPAIDAGKLRHPITILRQVAGTDASGACVTWTALLSTRASIEPGKATDRTQAGQTTADVEIPVTIRYRAGIEANMRVQAHNGTYVIRAIENVDERNVKLVLWCVALGEQQ